MRHRTAARAAAPAPSARPAAEDKRLVKKPAGVVGAEDTDAEVEGVGDEADADVIEDTDDLEDDADAIGPDIEVTTDRDEAER